MLVVETIAKIRRAFFGQGKAIKAICRELGLSRKVVRKVKRHCLHWSCPRYVYLLAPDNKPQGVPNQAQDTSHVIGPYTARIVTVQLQAQRLSPVEVHRVGGSVQ